MTVPIPPNMIHQVDETYAAAREDLQRVMAEAKPWLAERGPAAAAAQLSVLLSLRGWPPDMLAGLAGVAVIELLRAADSGDGALPGM